MTVLVCGGRDYDQYDVVDAALKRLRITRLIEGGARGADRLAHRWRMAHQVPGKTYHADWKRHGKAAGFRRNQEMLDSETVVLVVAFPGGAGTADMVRRAKKAGIDVWEPHKTLAPWPEC